MIKEKILAALEKGGWYTAQQIAQEAGLSTRQVRGNVAVYVKNGLVEKDLAYGTLVYRIKRHTPANSFVSSGGWAAPAIHPLDELQNVVPEVSVNRGGLDFNTVARDTIEVITRRNNVLVLEDDDDVIWIARRA